ncbi:TraB/GumN family protein [Pedobacter sp. MR2016-19]|uniref:TraB/GumN family protein n=1 Tax=Pedobacter sp. MR2016-19 TaxID=2780089 RepID=UPI0018770B43|nr:TraB/GumN family protein [Pedobacter sp. MR2016-19]MBE5317615.1 TraB/GumN family protein [Pedobacter sp. MR2016-19]
MKNFKLLFIALLGFGLSLNAQTKKATNTLLWEISGNGLKKPSYLFGTYHLISAKFADTMKVLQEKLESADAVVGEIVMDSSTQSKIAPFLIMKDNTLDRLLTKAEFKEVEDYFKTKQPGFELEQMNKFKPAMVSIMMVLFESPDMLNDISEGIDDSFQKYARKNGKSLYGLETAEYQGALLFDSDLQKQKKALLKSIREADKSKQQMEELKTNYIAQDIDKLTDFFKIQDEETKEFMTELLKNRNKRWLDQLPALMQNQSLFIAVGAGHLVGAEGLIKGLQLKGYILQPVATN